MALIEFDHPAQLRPLIGTEIAVSDWVDVGQDRIDRFAAATGDNQWIHMDPVRAANESPFGGTIAHGFLTLSLIPALLGHTVHFRSGRMSINYGLNRVRFTAPLQAGKRVRARITPLQVAELPGACQLTWKVVIEIEGVDKPACVAETVSRRYE